MSDFKLKPQKLRKHTTSHAILRYMEIVDDENFDDVREAMLSKAVYQAIKSGAEAYEENGLRFLIRDGKIISVERAKSKDL